MPNPLRRSTLSGTRVASLYEAAHRVPDIKSADVADKVTVLIKQIAVADKNATKCKAEEKRPHLDANNNIEAFFKPYSEMLGNAKKVAGQKLTTWQVEQRRLANEQAEDARKKADEEAKKLQESAKNEIEKQRADTAVEKAKTIKAADTSVRTDYGQTSSLRTVTTIHVDDINKIPVKFFRKYMTVEVIEKATRAAIKAGETEIPGIIIKKEQQSVVR